MPIPKRITAGDTPAWTDARFDLGDGVVATPASHILTTALRGPNAGAKSDLVAATVDGAWRTTLPGNASAALNTGNAVVRWYWQASVAAAGVKTTVGEGVVDVEPNFANAATFDGRTQAERDLAAVNAEISARASGGATVEYTIGSRSLKKEPLAALIALQRHLQLAIQREGRASAIAAGLGNPGRVLVRFGRR